MPFPLTPHEAFVGALPVPVGEPSPPPRPCECAMCDESAAANVALERHQATRMTLVWSRGDSPPHKAHVSLASGRMLFGKGETIAGAVLSAFNSQGF